MNFINKHAVAREKSYSNAKTVLASYVRTSKQNSVDQFCKAFCRKTKAKYFYNTRGAPSVKLFCRQKCRFERQNTFTLVASDDRQNEPSTKYD